jgi:hypothetical protein
MRRVLMFILGLLVVALLMRELMGPLLGHQEVRNAQQRIERAWSDWSQGDTGR